MAAVQRLLELSWNAIDGIKQRAVQRGLAWRAGTARCGNSVWTRPRSGSAMIMSRWSATMPKARSTLSTIFTFIWVGLICILKRQVNRL